MMCMYAVVHVLYDVYTCCNIFYKFFRKLTPSRKMRKW